MYTCVRCRSLVWCTKSMRFSCTWTCEKRKFIYKHVNATKDCNRKTSMVLLIWANQCLMPKVTRYILLVGPLFTFKGRFTKEMPSTSDWWLAPSTIAFSLHLSSTVIAQCTSCSKHTSPAPCLRSGQKVFEFKNLLKLIFLGPNQLLQKCWILNWAIFCSIST